MQKDYVAILSKRMRSEFYRNFSENVFKKKKYSKLFWEMYYWLDKTKEWDLKQFREYQLYQLQKQIHHAYHHTSYYRRLFEENGWRPQDFQDFNDFRKIPILTKKDWKEHIEELTALPRRKCRLVTTGGSTGIPTPIYHQLDKTSDVYMAFVWQWYNEGGYHLGDKAAILRGTVIKNGCYEFIKNTDELHCSSMKMTEKNMKEYLFRMEQYGIKVICAYPSTAELLAKYVDKMNIPFNESGKIKSLFTSSESLTKQARKYIENILHLRVFDLYGNSEQMGMIAQLRDGLYHEYMCHSYVEYLDECNRPVQSGRGRIVATGFINEAMPVLRYDTEDYADIIREKSGSKYNAQNIVKSIYGRRGRDEFIVGRDGNTVNFVAINSHADIFRHVYKFQVVQEEKGKVKLNIMPSKDFTRLDYVLIQQEFRTKLGEMFELDVNVTDQFEYTLRGKERLLVQKLVMD